MSENSLAERYTEAAKEEEAVMQWSAGNDV